ncbi:hypothetical protein [Nonomuraea sp. NPDC050783]
MTSDDPVRPGGREAQRRRTREAIVDLLPAARRPQGGRHALSA